MLEEVKKILPEGYTVEIQNNEDEYRLTLRADRMNILKFSYMQYPDCCGICIIHDFVHSRLDKYQPAIIAVLEKFCELAACDPEFDGAYVYNGPYGIIMAADTDEAFIETLRAVGFKHAVQFENPKTENIVYTLINELT